MSVPTASVANTPTVSGTIITYTWSATNATSYTVNLYQLTSSATTIVQTLSTTALTTTTYTPAVSGSGYMFTMSATNANGTAQQVASPTLFYALSLIGGPQGVQGNPGVQGLQGPQGVPGNQGAQGIQGILSLSNYTGANAIITTQASGAGAVYANSGLTYDGTRLTVGGNITTGTGSSSVGGVTLSNGAIIATSINNGTSTFTVTSTTGTNSNTLTVGAGNGTGNAISTTGTIRCGDITASGTVTAPTITNQSGTSTGFVNLTQGGSANTGYIDFLNASSIRKGYIGFATDTRFDFTASVPLCIFGANVGISPGGAFIPSYPLDVNGSIRTSGGIVYSVQTI